jgi:hypothetical protein
MPAKKAAVCAKTPVSLPEPTSGDVYSVNERHPKSAIKRPRS